MTDLFTHLCFAFSVKSDQSRKKVETVYPVSADVTELVTFMLIHGIHAMLTTSINEFKKKKCKSDKLLFYKELCAELFPAVGT